MGRAPAPFQESNLNRLYDKEVTDLITTQLRHRTEEIIRISARVSFTTFTLIFMGLHTFSEYVSPSNGRSEDRRLQFKVEVTDFAYRP